MKYRKKPVVVDAWRFDIAEWKDMCKRKIPSPFPVHPGRGGMPEIVTLEGVARVKHGDYIIRGVRGEFYPCNPGIFKETYEAVAALQATGEWKGKKSGTDCNAEAGIVHRHTV